MVSLNPAHWPRTAKLVAAFATLYVVWGSTYLGIKIGLNAGLPPTAFAAMRLVPAGLVMLGLARLRGKSLKMRPADLRITAIVGIFLLVGGMYSTFLAERTINSGLAALIVALLPLWIALAESVLPGMERPSARGVAGLVLGFSGLGILMAPRLTGVTGTARELAGIGIMIVGTWLWTAGSVISKKRPVRADAMVATGYEMLTAGAVLCVIATVLGEWGSVSFTPAGVGALAYLILVGSALAFTAFVWLLRNAPASKVMTYAYVNPVVAAFLGWLVLGERLDPWAIAGMVVIVIGVALATSAPTRPPREAKAGSVA
ncbi:MAG TPA: EamA family transporter [Coriobacteriia bacterium]